MYVKKREINTVQLRYIVSRAEVKSIIKHNQAYIDMGGYDELKRLVQILQEKLQTQKGKWIKFTDYEMVKTGFTDEDGNVMLSESVRINPKTEFERYEVQNS